MKRIITLLAVVAIPVAASAQSQRVVLIEHFTQASCGPCATYNPALNALINNNAPTVISIKYQTSWPGVDPMNAHNPTEVANRVTYYNQINSVPRAVIDGNFYNGTPAPANVNQAKLDQRIPVPSPVTVSVSHAINQGGDSIRVRAVVRKTDAIPASANLKLRMAVIERDIYFPVAPGSNGEMHFESVMKKMLPNPGGSTIAAMNVGDSVVIAHSWKLQNVYDMTQLAAVAFVQDDATKEVLNAGYAAPNFPLNLNMASTDNIKAKIAGQNAQGVYNMKFKTDYTTSGVYRLTLNKSQLPAGWDAEFMINGTTYSNFADVTMAALDSQNVQVKIMTGSAPNEKGVVTLEGYLTTNYSAYVARMNATAFTKIRTAFVNKGGSNNTFLNGFTAAGTTVVQIAKEEFEGMDPNGFTAANVDHLFLSTGQEYSNTLLTNSEVDALSAYLNSGGKVFASGQDIGYSAYPGGGSSVFKQFYQDYLGATFLNDGDDDGVAISADTSDSWFGTLGNSTLNTAAFTLYSDVIDVNASAPNATPIIMYNNLNISGYTPTTGVAAVRNFGTDWKTVYVAFLPEAISSAAFRNALLDLTIDWFDGVVSAPEFDEQLAASVMKAYPNPARNQFTVEFTEAPAATKLSVVDMLGRVVATENIVAGNSNLTINTTALDAGTYFLRLEGSKIMENQKLVVVK